MTKVNCGTGGSFTINKKDDYWLDGDGNDHINNLKQVGVEKTAGSEYIKDFDKNLLVDLDDVVHNLNRSKYKHDKIEGEPVEGAKEYLGK